MNISDILNSRFTLFFGILIYAVGSIGDIITTWYGFSNGYSEQSPIVRYLMNEMGILEGLIFSKVFVFVFIVTITYVFYRLSDRCGEVKVSSYYGGFLLGSAGLIYGFATVHNYNLLFG